MAVVTSITIGSETFYLRDDIDLHQLERAVAQAIRNGADVVDLPVVQMERVRVILSPGVVVLFRQREVEADRDHIDDVHPATAFLDYTEFEDYSEVGDDPRADTSRFRRPRPTRARGKSPRPTQMRPPPRSPEPPDAFSKP